MASKIYLIRHGITEGNQKKWFYGAADIPLAEEGKEELQRLKEKNIYPVFPEDADLYTTGMLRTEQTFEILFGDKPHKAIDKLKEMAFGEYECTTYEEVKQYEDFDKWAWDTTGDVKLPGAESKNEFAARIEEGVKELRGYHRLKELSHRHSGKDSVSVVVCHGGVIAAAMMLLFREVNGNMWDWMPQPGYGYCIEFEEGEPTVYTRISDMKKLGFGFMRLPKKDDGYDMDQLKDMVDLFLEKGFTYFDTAWGYDNGQCEAVLKEVLVDRYPREAYQIATKLPAWSAATEEEAKAMFDTSLERIGVEYFDYYLLHNLGDVRTKLFDDFHLWDFLAKKKEEGLIKQLGFSFHDKAEVLDEILTAHPEMDFVQLQINYADWESPTVQSKACYEVARKHHKPVIVMEPVKGGSLAKLPEHVETIFRKARPDASIASWALRYAASLPGVMMVLSGMSSMEQMKDNVETMDDFRPLNEVDHCVVVEAVAELDKMPQVPCTDCRYCIKGCPQGVAIPGIFKAMNTEFIYGNTVGAKGNYVFATGNNGKASKCIGCGGCEEVCPQHIKIIDQLKKAVDMFE